MAITPTQKNKYWTKRQAGYSQQDSAKAAGFSIATANRLEANYKASERGKELLNSKAQDEMPNPKTYDELSSEAKRALEDFIYFQRRYFGRIPTPWQKESADIAVKLLETPYEEYVVVNCPPGAGKTTLFSHDIPAWLTCRNRAIRGMIGGATSTAAAKSVGRLKRTFESVQPIKADINDVRKGLAVDADACLSVDFGRFKPTNSDLWRRDDFLVMQPGEHGNVTEKESTWSAYGIDTSFIGTRVDFVIWDDLVDSRKIRTQEQKEKLQDDFTTLCETRLEPGGLLILQGQRLQSDDLYRFALDMTAPEFEEYEQDELEDMFNGTAPPEHKMLGPDRQGKKYHHIIFQAHYDEKCDDKKTHKRTAAPYPNGCLLDPRRLNWRKLSTLMQSPSANFETVYQQKDVNPSNVLVPNAWVYGHDEHIGCIDKWRDRLEIPSGLDAGDCISVATADPSPTNYWSVQWWIYDPKSENRYLIDLLRKKMDAPDFLDWSTDRGEFVGVMNDWQQASKILGFPIQTWIIEANAAQRFMLQYEHVRRWRSLNDVDILPHTTSRNKSDPNFGVETIAPHWRFGRVRLPGKGDGKVKSMHLIDEVTKYPHGRTDDCVMAEWFFEWNLPNLSAPNATIPVASWRPSWIA